ncbi:MFS transporter [Dactylosporangium matsuzakiense]|uniref:MFS transporter n=1 Tax=Dactylosporangium matsuzakiense TaxID=53360 RepID=A0A9W6KMX4_9ACTN|nr:MFS transporter [Dactylosporangium matsuzakiense]UWZ41949.1 MFS transporter [Dactylosporangium matsuzakiense]GLL04981.1 MFS transporter [Dactylosporangium matsuzakiense]
MRDTPYRPVLRHPMLRRILPGLGISALGDGMSLVAVSWLALTLAPPASRGTWVAAAVAAYSLPSALGGVLLRRYLRHRHGAQLAGWNAVLRASALGAIVLVNALGALSLAGYVGLLAVSSLLAAWGSAGRYTLIADVLPPEHHLAANGLMGTLTEASAIAGPPLAGLLIGWTGPVFVLALDAASFAVLAVTYRLAVPRGAGPAPAGEPEADTPDGPADTAGAGRNWLTALSFVFFLLFGPFYVALPLHIADDRHASATLLGLYYTVFGIGAVAGGLTSAYLRRLPLRQALFGIVLAFSLAVLPLGLDAPVWLTLPAFALAGLCWAPYMPLAMALFQRTVPPARLSQVLAVFGSVTVIAVPLGTAAGGPLVTWLGPRQTLLVSAAAMALLGAGGAAVTIVRSFRKPGEKTHPDGYVHR